MEKLRRKKIRPANIGGGRGRWKPLNLAAARISKLVRNSVHDASNFFKTLTLSQCWPELSHILRYSGVASRYRFPLNRLSGNFPDPIPKCYTYSGAARFGGAAFGMHACSVSLKLPGALLRGYHPHGLKMRMRSPVKPRSLECQGEYTSSVLGILLLSLRMRSPPDIHHRRLHSSCTSPHTMRHSGGRNIAFRSTTMGWTTSGPDLTFKFRLMDIGIRRLRQRNKKSSHKKIPPWT